MKSGKGFAFNEQALLQHALGFHQAGRLPEAEQGYRLILANNPRSFNALGMLGTVMLQRGQIQSAIEHFRQSLALQPRQAYIQNNLGTALRACGQLAEALSCFELALKNQFDYREAVLGRSIVLQEMGRIEEALKSFGKMLALDPKCAEAYLRRGNILLGMGNFSSALESYDAVLRLQPVSAGVMNNRALCLLRLDRCEEALGCLDTALTLQADFAEGLVARGNVLRAMGRNEEAERAYLDALVIRPDYIDALNNLGNLYRELRRPDLAVQRFDRILKLDPSLASAHGNRASALHAAGLRTEALMGYAGALALDPAFVEVWSNRGELLLHMRELSAARASLRKALELSPEYPDARWNLAFLDLLEGRYEEGWAGYEWRWRSVQRHSRRTFSSPVWDGRAAVAGKRVLLHVEQGLGDTLQFCRYVLLLAARGAEVVLEVQRPLVGLLRSLEGVAEFFVEGEDIPAHDLHCALLSLPYLLGTRLDSIPTADRYLKVDDLRAGVWRERLGSRGSRPRVGIVWSGNPVQGNDRNRSMPLECLAPMLDLPVDLYVLQRDVRPGDQSFLDAHPQIICLQGNLQDFADTAALVGEMDLVVSVCTSVAHLAGALGLPVWVMLCHEADFRWLLDREDSPWYPSARLFRQTHHADWRSVVSAVCEALGQRFGFELALRSGNDVEAPEMDVSALESQGRMDTLLMAGKHVEALNECEAALALNPDSATVWLTRALALEKLVRGDEAIDAGARALSLAADDMRIHGAYAALLHRLGRRKEALTAFDALLARWPDAAEAHAGRALLLHETGQFEAALRASDRALDLLPDSAPMRNNRGIILKDLQRLDEAQADYETSIALQPDFADAHWNLGLLHFLRGDLEKALPLYEWRWKRETHSRLLRDLGCPRWSGKESLAGRTILLHPEQGLGDIIQFVRFLPKVMEQGANVVLELPPPLLQLMSCLPAPVQRIAYGASRPSCDYECPLMSLPLALGITLAHVKATAPYLRADEGRTQHWAERMGARSRMRVGIVWSGNAQHLNDHNRSIPFSKLDALLTDAFEWHSLQKEIRSDDLAPMQATTVRDWRSALSDFSETAALITQLDLVISVDTSVAHLAGALGKPVWMLLPRVPDYRWMLDRDDSPWYADMRLFRQTTQGQWQDVVERVRIALEGLLQECHR